MAEKFDRNQFKATSVAELKKLKTEEDAVVGTGSFNKDFISIEEGTNKIRLAPKFPHEKDFYLMRMTHWGSIEKDGGDLVRIPILNSKIHGGTKLDIFESYIAFAQERMADKPEQIKVITDWQKGISASVTWWAYGWLLKKDKDPKFGIYEFKKSIRDQINSLCIIEDEEEAIETDPFTDVDTGKPIIVTFNPKEKNKKDWHKIQLAKNEFPLTDKMFEELLSKEPLTKMMRGVYDMEMFEKACEAIRNFDVENELDLFDDGDFQETVALVKAQYTSKGKEVDKKKTTSKVKEEPETKKTTKKVETKKVKGDKFTDMDRTELKEYIGEEELEISVKKSDSDDDIRNKIRTYEAENSKEEVEEDDEVEEKVVKGKKEEKKPALTIAELRAKLAADKKK